MTFIPCLLLLLFVSMTKTATAVVHDVFMLNYELDMLKIRTVEHNDVVDITHVGVCPYRAFQGHAHPQWVTESQHSAIGWLVKHHQHQSVHSCHL